MKVNRKKIANDEKIEKRLKIKRRRLTIENPVASRELRTTQERERLHQMDEKWTVNKKKTVFIDASLGLYNLYIPT